MPDASPLVETLPAAAPMVRQALDRSGYTEPAIAGLLGASEVPGARQCRRELPAYLRRTRGDSPLETLVRLFLLNQSVPPETARRAIEPTPLAEWQAAGLLAEGPGGVRASIELGLFRGLVLAADWMDTAATEPVMGVAGTSRLLAQMTVRGPAGRALDLGTGGGVQALLAARHCGHVSATELNPRGVHISRFNAVLNGLTNVEFLVGDLFGPIRGREFDRVVCNPPFVIGPVGGHLHTHGGRPADEFSRDVIRAAPAFLRPGGYLQMVGDWAQLAGRGWRERLAEWFDGSGCDAWVLHTEVEAADAYARKRIEELYDDPGRAAAAFDEWVAYYERAGIEGVVSGVITLRRSERRPNWVRFNPFPGVAGEGGAAVAGGFAARDFLADHAGDRELLGARLCHAAHLNWEQRHEARGGGWAVASSRLRLSDGLRFVADVEPSVAAFVGRCRGDRPLAAALAEVARETGQDADRLRPAFLKVVRGLVEKGFLLPAGAER